MKHIAAVGRAWRALGRIAGASALGVAVVAAAPTLIASPASAMSTMVTAAAEELDRLVMRNGRVIEGRVLDVSASSVRMEVIVAGISAVQTFDRADVLSIERAAETNEPAEDAGEAAEAERDADRGEASTATGGPVIYHMTLRGVLGREIHPVPVEDMLNDARQHKPDYLIVEIDNAWESWFGQELSEEQASFDQFFQAEGVLKLFTRNMPMEWEKQPRIVFWVKNAMGGVAFMPFLGDEIYFHPEGRMGGVGNLSEMMAGVGDAVVREKQRSLRMAMAEGIAIRKDYDYRLVRAMARREYVLSYDLTTGELLEREPIGVGEAQLTDDGTDEEQRDNMSQMVRGTSNDVLTLREDTAVHIGVSQGTARTMDDLLDELGVLRNHTMAESRSDRILEQWEDAVARAKREIPKMLREFEEVGQNAARNNRAPDPRRVIGRRIRILEDIRSMLERYDGAIIPQEVGVAGIPQINLQIEGLKIQLIQMNP